jgi:hypothetical protein
LEQIFDPLDYFYGVGLIEKMGQASGHNNLYYKMLLFMFVPQKIDPRMVFISLSSRYLFEFTIFSQMKIGIDPMTMGLFFNAQMLKKWGNRLIQRFVPQGLINHETFFACKNIFYP